VSPFLKVTDPEANGTRELKQKWHQDARYDAYVDNSENRSSRKKSEHHREIG